MPPRIRPNRFSDPDQEVIEVGLVCLEKADEKTMGLLRLDHEAPTVEPQKHVGEGSARSKDLMLR